MCANNVLSDNIINKKKDKKKDKTSLFRELTYL